MQGICEPFREKQRSSYQVTFNADITFFAGLVLVLVIAILLVKVVKKPNGDQQPNHNICWSSQLANLH